MQIIWYRDPDGIVRSLECATLIYAQAAWDILSRTKYMISTRP